MVIAKLCLQKVKKKKQKKPLKYVVIVTEATSSKRSSVIKHTNQLKCFFLSLDVVTNPAETTDHSSHSHTDPKESVLMSPAVRILLETYRLNPRLIPATGPKGRLLKGDVLRYVAQEGKPFTKPGEAEVTTKTAMPTTMPPLVTPLQPDKSETTGEHFFFKVLRNNYLNLEHSSYRNYYY